jgi:predicted enzyme related to lactoylglutathione lyase
MTDPVYFVELNSPDHETSAGFFRDVFGWDPQPFASPDYLVAPHGESAGIDSALLPSRDGQPRTVPVIRVTDLDATLTAVEEHGGRLVVPVFEMGGLGKGCYITDPAGFLVGLHYYNAPL